MNFTSKHSDALWLIRLLVTEIFKLSLKHREDKINFVVLKHSFFLRKYPIISIVGDIKIMLTVFGHFGDDLSKSQITRAKFSGKLKHCTFY